jgi:hypothetical protein
MSVSPPKRIVYGFKTDVLQQQLRVQCSLLWQRPLRGGFRSIYCLTTSFFFMQPGFSAMFVLLSVIYAVSLAAKRD